LLNCGIRFVEVETMPEYEKAFTDRTMMTHFLQRRRRGKPSIEWNPATGKKNAQGLTGEKDSIVVGVWMPQPGEDMIVGRSLHDVLSKACAPSRV
jgi:hypothetical protein